MFSTEEFYVINGSPGGESLHLPSWHAVWWI